MGISPLNQVNANMGRRFAAPDSQGTSGVQGNPDTTNTTVPMVQQPLSSVNETSVGAGAAADGSSSILQMLGTSFQDLLNKIINGKPGEPYDAAKDPFGDLLSWMLMNRQMSVFNDYAQGKMSASLRNQVEQHNSTYTDDNNSVPLSDANGRPINYNAQTGNVFANIAEANAEDKNTVGNCLQGVREALEKAGFTKGGGGSLGASAYQAPEKLMSNPNFKANFTQTNVTTGNDLKGKSLRRGTVIVWQPSPGHPHGHITVIVGKDKNGRMMEASDHVTEFKIREGVGCDVYEPSAN